MSVRNVLIYGNPILRQKTAPVKEFGPELKQLVQDMFDTVVAVDGVGLAASQVGESVRVMVLNLQREDQEPLMIPIINAELLESGGESELEEGCLSVPDIKETVTRPEWIRFRYQDLEGQWHEVRANGLMARVVQHELDHLDGILFVDRLGIAKRALLSGKLKQMARDQQRVSKT